MRVTRRGVLTKVETILLTVCGVYRLILTIYTKQERALYSGDFEEEYKKTEERIRQEMEKHSQPTDASIVCACLFQTGHSNEHFRNSNDRSLMSWDN